MDLYLTYDDVLLLPQYSDFSPTKADPTGKFSRRIELKAPFVSAAMDTVTESEMVLKLSEIGASGVIHKNMDPEDQAAEVKRVKDAGHKAIAAISVGEKAIARANVLREASVDGLVVDVAHGHIRAVIDTVKALKDDSNFSEIDIIAGNVVSEEATLDLIAIGADAVKVGMGPGSICTTRVIAGIGVPQLSAVMNAVRGRNRHFEKTGEYIPVIADGGMRSSGDLVKALAAGADSGMFGNMFAGTDESPGEVENVNGVMYKTYRGMGSIAAMSKGSKDRYGQGEVESKDDLVAEGVVGKVLYKGSALRIAKQIEGGVRAGLAYQGCRTLKELHERAQFIRISSAGIHESRPHTLRVIED